MKLQATRVVVKTVQNSEGIGSSHHVWCRFLMSNVELEVGEWQ
jgi:hypothetical protein